RESPIRYRFLSFPLSFLPPVRRLYTKTQTSVSGTLLILPRFPVLVNRRETRLTESNSQIAVHRQASKQQPFNYCRSLRFIIFRPAQGAVDFCSGLIHL